MSQAPCPAIAAVALPAGAEQVATTLDRVAGYRFRARFHLRAQERAYVMQRGAATVRRHAEDFVAARLAPERPRNDGRQTPWGGHPVFRGQHATGTCCRSCLARLHGIPAGRELSPEQQAYVVDLLCAWVEREMRAVARG